MGTIQIPTGQMIACFLLWGAPLLRFAGLRAAAGSGLLRGTLPLPPRPCDVYFQRHGRGRFAALAPFASLTRASAPAALVWRRAAQVSRRSRDD
ncbi:MAG: hypothetical protein RML37_12140, partial [Chitinophagales bacterium]|nr:hypothetical protein [Chitinophagales bacterium]